MTKINRKSINKIYDEIHNILSVSLFIGELSRSPYLKYVYQCPNGVNRSDIIYVDTENEVNEYITIINSLIK